MCGVAPVRGLGRAWQGRFAARWLGPDLVLLRADSTSWPSPGNVLVVLDGDGAALIDCGFGTEGGLDALAQALKSAGVGLDDVHTVLCTHPHADHAGAAGALSGNRRLMLPAGARAVLDDPARVAAAVLPEVVLEFAPWLADLDIGHHFRTECGAAALPAGHRVEDLHPGEVIRLGRYEWTAVSAPGHDAHLMCYWDKRSGMLVYSDVLCTRGTAIPWYAPGGGGTRAYLESLRSIAGLGASLGISGHGGLLEGADAIRASVSATASQITGRTERISARLAQGPASFTELERCVYPQAVHDVIPWASSVAAVHLLEAMDAGTARPASGGYLAAGAGR